MLRRAIWLETDKQYKSAAEALIKIKTGKEVKVETAEGAAPDFTHEQPHTYIGPETSFQLERKPWEEKVRAYTKEFRDSPAVINSIVTFTAQAQNAYQITSEGTQLQYGQIRYRLEMFIQGKAPDGMDLERYYNFDWVNPADAPDDKAVYAAGATMRKELEGLVAAPINEPSVGPALLTGTRSRGFLSRSLWASRRGPSAERRCRRADLREKSERADLAGLPEHRGRHHDEEAGLDRSAGLLRIRRRRRESASRNAGRSRGVEGFRDVAVTAGGFSALQRARPASTWRVTGFAPGKL